MRRLLFPMCALASALVFSSAVIESFAQSASNSDTPQNGIALTKLSPPVYPPLARQARITGDVDLLLGIRGDGTVESVVVVTGHPMLKQAAVASAQQSQFVCRGCSEGVTSYSLLYTFRLTGGKCCEVTEASSNSEQQETQPAPVSQSQNHITVIAHPTCICDPGADVRKVRSAKCLYLWGCGFR